MEAFVEMLKPCLVLIGPILFFAFKRLSELQQERNLDAHSLTVQDFVEKLTKTPLHMARCKRTLKKEKKLLFERERHLKCKCKALQNRLQYEISKNDYLNTLNVEQVYREGELMKENFYLRLTVKKLRKYIFKHKIHPKRHRCHLGCFHDYERMCIHCSTDEHLHLFAKPYAPCHLKKKSREPKENFYEPLYEELGETDEDFVNSDENCIHDDDEAIDNSMREQEDFDSTERCSYVDQQFNYYQTYFS